MKRNKSGISLVVLVITIIIMIILAGSIIMSLSNSGIIGKAGDAVEATNLKQVQEIAALAWSEAYIDKLTDSSVNIQQRVEEALYDKNNVDRDKYVVNVTNSGVSVQLKSTLGSLVASAADYGKTVNYEANGITDWKVFYETDSYVYLIASEKLAYNKVPTNIPGATLSSNVITLSDGTTRTVGSISWANGSEPTNVATIQNPSRWMANWSDYSTNINGRCVSYFLDETYWSAFKNTTATYKDYVVGAIGTPTAEMFAASWNAKRAATGDTTKYNNEITLTVSSGVPNVEAIGYAVSGNANVATDTLYCWATDVYASVHLASPSSEDVNWLMDVYVSAIGPSSTTAGLDGFRPVICLRSDIPAAIGTTTDYML